MMSTELLRMLISQCAQVAFLACVVWLITRHWTKQRSHFNHALWVLVLLKCVTPPVVASPTSLFSWFEGSLITKESPAPVEQVSWTVQNLESAPLVTAEQVPAAPVQVLAPDPVTIDLAQVAVSIAVYSWLLGILTVGVIAATKLLLFRRKLHRTQSSDLQAHQTIQALTDEAASQLGLKRLVRVHLTKSPVGPAVMGLMRPVILLPEALVSHLKSERLSMLITHELVHLRRGDLFWSALQVTASSLLWCNPFAWIASRLLDQEAEKCCDEETIAALGIDPADYAKSLLAVLELKHTLRAAPLLPGIRPVDITAKRLEKIMCLRQGCQARRPWWVSAAFAAAALLCLPGAAFTIAQEGKRLPPAPAGMLPKQADFSKPSSKPLVEKNDVTYAKEWQPIPGAVQRHPVRLPPSRPSQQPPSGRFIQFDVKLLKVPAEIAEKHCQDWVTVEAIKVNQLDRDGEVVQAAFTPVSVPSGETKTVINPEIEDLEAVLTQGESLSAPTMTALDGTACEMTLGSEHPFVTSVRPMRSKDGKVAVQPVITLLESGVKLRLTGKIVSENELDLEFSLRESKVYGADDFTFEIKGMKEPVTVQQPRYKSRSVNVGTKLDLKDQTTFAICHGPHTEVVTKETDVPILNKIPYVSKLFKNVAAAKQTTYTVVLIEPRLVEEQEQAPQPVESDKGIAGQLVDPSSDDATHSSDLKPAKYRLAVPAK
ncbi:MAG: M56 family metallopeptidase [Planctomycetota bacterium]